jgi:hypothetical protein
LDSQAAGARRQQDVARVVAEMKKYTDGLLKEP